MAGPVTKALKKCNESFCRYLVSRRIYKPGIISLLFHNVFEDDDEIRGKKAYPMERFTISDYRKLIECFLDLGCRFDTPRGLIAEPRPESLTIVLTFDDGYYNNTRILPVLSEFSIPAVFFISSRHISEGKCFWWDVLYRHGIATGKSHAKIQTLISESKTHRTSQIEANLKKQLGTGALDPVGDLDRPFTVDELKDFAGSRYVEIGNHTYDHAILTNYDDTEVHQQIKNCQNDLKSWTGEIPVAVSYPNGNWSRVAESSAAATGLKVGITVRSGKNTWNDLDGRSLRLFRYRLEGGLALSFRWPCILSDWWLYDQARERVAKMLGNK